MGLLDSYKKILQDYKTKVIDEVKERVLGRSAEETSEDKEESILEERFFYSFGVNSQLKRYKQALQAFGLECNYTTVMYMLQSYGLIPPDMTRKEFEYYFTPLNEGEIGLPSKRFPFSRQNMFSILNNDKGKCGEILRGYDDWVSSFISQSNQKSKLWLKEILWTFKIQATFNLTASAKKWKSKNDIVIEDFNDAINNGSLPSQTYFEDGNTVFAGVAYRAGSKPEDAGTYKLDDVGKTNYHYALIVKEPIGEFAYDNIKYYLFPADDAFREQTFVIAPYFKEKITLLNSVGINLYSPVFTHAVFISDDTSFLLSYKDVVTPEKNYRVTNFLNFALGVY